MVFLAGVRVYGVKHNVRVDMPTIHVGSNYRLIAVQMFRCKSFCDLQRQFRCDLARLEGLDNMVILDAPHVFSVTFGIQHLTAFPARITALMGSEDLLLRLIAVEDVVDPDIQPTFSGQDLCDSHYGLATWYINS